MSDQPPGEPPHRLFRILPSAQPTEDDFKSKLHLGIPCPVSDPDVQQRWNGLSVFGSEEQARRVSRRLPMLGEYIAELNIPPGAGMRAEPTPGPGHYTIGGDPGRGTALAGKGASDMPDTDFMYEVWELESRSLVAAYPDQAEALALDPPDARLRLDDGRARAGRRERALRAARSPGAPDRCRTGRAPGGRYRMKPRMRM